jgi:multidrug efflux pump subunit AcrB
VKHFNISEWAITHRSFIYFLMAVALVAGVASYKGLGREEDPSFAIKTMLVQAQWPGATVQETMEQVTERIEKELRQIPQLDYVKSFTTPGNATVYVELKDTTKSSDIPWIWYLVRKYIDDIKGQFPRNMQGPTFDDEFGDVYGNVYAFTGDGFSPRQVRDAVEQVRLAIVDVPGLGKTQMIGDRNETIYLDVSTQKLAGLSIDQQTLISMLQEQNDITATGVVQAGPERVALRVSGVFKSEESLKDVNLRVNGKFFRLSDVGHITRGYEDPPQTLFRVDGRPAIGLAIGMQPGSNVVAFGKA